VTVHLKAGTHLAKLNNHSPDFGQSGVLYLPPFQPSNAILYEPEPTLYAMSIYFIGDDTTDVEAAQAGTASGTQITRSTGTWTVDQHRGKFCLITSGAGAGTKAVIAGNSTTVLTLATYTLPSGSCNFKVVEPAAKWVDSTDGMNFDGYGMALTANPSIYVFFDNIQFGTAALPFAQITMDAGANAGIWNCVVINKNPTGLVWASYLYNASLSLWNCYWKADASYSFLLANRSMLDVDSCLFDFKIATNYSGFAVREEGKLRIRYSYMKALSGHAKPLIYVYLNGIVECAGPIYLDGLSAAPGIVVGDGATLCSDSAITIDNTTTALSCNGRADIAAILGSGNTNGFVLDAGAVVSVPTTISGLSATNPIILDGTTYQYTNIPNLGDWIEGPSGSRIIR
jgi:hypothetical protein